MENLFWTNFFRKDLNLGNHWWHRLFLVIFFISFLWSLYIIYDAFFLKNNPYVPKWRVIESLSERITPEIKPISAMIKNGEKIGENDRAYILNDSPDSYYLSTINDVYCSTELAENYEKVKNMRNIDALYIGGSFNRSKVTPETFVNYIKQNNIHCLTVDAYTTYDTTGNADGKLHFLEPDKSYQKNWSFFKKSVFLTTIEVLKTLLFAIAIFAGIIITYYKIFLYIIFGKAKNITTEY